MFSKFYTSIPRWYLAGMFLLTFNYILTHIYPDWFHLFALPSMNSTVTDFVKLFVCSLVTDEIITLAFTLAALLIFERLIFRIWSRGETAFFLLIIAVLPPFMSALTMRFVLSSNVLFYGGSAFVSAVTVLATQKNADHFLFGYGTYGLKSKLGISCGFLLYSVFSMIGITSWMNILLFTNGFLCSWFYLRFLQHRSQRRYGDHRPGFAFAKFFPGPLEDFVAGPTNLVYQLLLRTNLCPSLERKCEIVSTASFAVNIPELTADSDRHRRLALNALNEQLSKSQSAAGGVQADQSSGLEWPSVDDSSETVSHLSTVVLVPTSSVTPSTATESMTTHSPQGVSSPSDLVPVDSQEEVVVVHVGADDSHG